MRDILTVIAGLVILILAAALIAPPFIDWEARRDVIDQAISRLAGVEARTEGQIGIRLLPSPRIRLDRLRLGDPEGDSPALTADLLWSEIALTPLLRGEVRFVDTRVGRADIRVPVSPDGRWRMPADFGAGEGVGREWAIDDLRVGHLLVTTRVPETGRTSQIFAEGVAIEGQKLTGPWRAEGTMKGVPFRIVTGELAADRTLQVKLTGGGDAFPRFDIDGKLALAEGFGVTRPDMSGKARLVFGPPAQGTGAGIPVPVALDAAFKTNAGVVELEGVTLDATNGGVGLRLTGTGTAQLDDPRIALKLEGRRIDADAFLQGGTLQQGGALPGDLAGLKGIPLPALPVPVDLDLSVTSIGLGQEELGNAVVRASLNRGRAQVEQIEFTAPGDTRITLSGGLGLTEQGGLNGRVAVTSADSDRFARYLERLGFGGPALSVLDGTPFEGAADVVLDRPVSAFRNVRLKTGTMTLTGQGRYTAPEGGARGRLEAQVGVRGLDLSQLPQVTALFDATQDLDVGFTLDARDVRAGNRGGAGRIAARIASDGPTLVVETLDVVDLAGANARVSGRIAPDGAGRIAGKVTAQRAAPLVDLLGSVWIGGVSKLVPAFLREGELDLDIVTERAAPGPGTSALRLKTTARGRAAGGSFEGEVVTLDGAAQSLDVRVTTDNTGRWLNRTDLAAMRRPSSVALRGTRVGSGLFNISVAGELGGTRITTRRPFALGIMDDVIESGEADIQTADLGPFLALLGSGAAPSGPIPADLRVTLAREQDASVVTLGGKIADEAVQARLAVRSLADVSGQVNLDRLSLPWLLATLALNPSEPSTSALWSNVKFGEGGRLPLGGQARLRVKRLDLGRGLAADGASFALGVTGDGLTIREFDAALGSGRLRGMLSITRQGPLASIVAEGGLRDVPLATLAGPTPLSARVTATMKVGASADSAAGLVANLGGAGEARLTGVQASGADPQALDRALKRLLADSDPLANRRAETIVGEELARAPIAVAALSAPVALVGGSFRLSPVVLDGGAAVWQGAITYDLKTLSLDARGTLTAKAAPERWTGAMPSVGLAWRGPLAAPAREIDPAPLANGLAAIVLQRELEKIEAFEAEQNERQRRAQQLNFQRQRERERQIAEEAARQARLREEQERARAEAERARAEAERVQAEQRARAEAERRAAQERAAQERAAQERAAQERAAQERAAQEAERRALQELQTTPSSVPALPPPIDIRPAPQIGVRPGG